MGTYSDNVTSGRTDARLDCGHVASVDAWMLQHHPDHLFWCRTCAELHRAAEEQT